MNSHKLAALKLGTLLLFASGISAIAAPPDLTNGGVPSSTVTTNLGPTGMRGWVYHQSIDSGESRQIQVQVVDAGSPAAGKLLVGDVILGADGTGATPVDFTADARQSFANAINDAEARTPAELKVLVWRAGTPPTISTETLTLRNMGAYSATAPYNCPKSAKILEEGLEAIMTTGETAGAFSFGTLSLLAGNNSANPKNAARQLRAQAEARALIPNAAKLADLIPAETGFLWGDPWADGHTLIVLTEYYLQTKDNPQTRDDSVLPAIDAYSKAVIGGQNLFGTYSHVYAARWRDGTPNGPMRNGYGTVNSASMPGWLGLLLTKECGVINPDLDPAIERASRFYAYYSGKGAIPYGEHDPYWQVHDNNGKSGLAALCYELESHRATPQKFFAKMAVAATTERDNGHTGPFFNHVWSPLGAAAGGEAAAASHFGKIRWMLDLNRRWNGLFVSNRYGEDSQYDSYSGFRMSTPALLTYALPLRQLHITGRGHDPLRQLSAQDVADAVAVDGYNAAPRSTTQLITDLGNWSPKVQRSAALELGNRAASITTTQRNSLHAMANDPLGTSRVGACFALGYIGNSNSASVLAALLTDPVNHVRLAAAEGLREMPQSARQSQLNTVLAAAASNAAPLLPYNEEDPAHLTHARFGPLLFDSSGMVPTNYSSVDRNLLYPAIRAVAQNPVGHCRSSLARIYNSLNQTDYLALADTVVFSAYELTPADKMFAYEDRFSALNLLERNNAAEGVPLCVQIIEDAMYNVNGPALATLQLYAGGSKTVNPDPGVEAAMNFLIQTGTNATEAQAVLAAIAADPSPATLPPLKSIQSATADATSVTLPANSTALHVTASDLVKGDSIYTWRKVHGVGAVTFAPNGTGTAKDSTVLINNAPGKYRFEVTMSDSLGLTEVYKTVNVTLYDSNGTLPSNNPPVADPQSLTVPRGIAIPITLSGSDPEAYPLNYQILARPTDGDLDGTPPNLTYTATPGGTATSDSFTFEVMDSEGQVDVATVSLNMDNSINGGVITWGAATNITSPTNVVTTGTLVNSRTGDDNSGTITVNGVAFSQGKILDVSGSYYDPLCPNTGTGAEKIALEFLLDRISWSGSSFQITGLTPGLRYLFQVFLSDYRVASRQMILGDTAAPPNTVTLTTNPVGAFGQFATGTFTASGPSQTITIAGGAGETTHINSWQVRLLPDSTPPNPSPTLWSSPPSAAGPDTILMRANAAYDASGVEYFFDETSGNPGGTDSGWQDSPSYADTGLTPDNSYIYTVTARDKSPAHNPASASAPASATTAAIDSTPPTPNPMTWATPPAASGTSSITMTVATATDANGVEYFFDETSGNAGGSDSGWQDSPSYADTGLTSGVGYTYTVMARDKSYAQNPTSVSASASATTNAVAPSVTVWNVNFHNQITTGANFIGAATENTAGSTWNKIGGATNSLPVTARLLADSSNVTTAGVTMNLSAVQNGTAKTNTGSNTITGGLTIFNGHIGGDTTSTTLSFNGLNPGRTYDMVIYSDWFYRNGGNSGLPVSQTLGTGLSGRIFVNRQNVGTNGTVVPLTEDTNSADVVGNTNWYRIRGLAPTSGGQIAFTIGAYGASGAQRSNTAFNGFQLIEFSALPDTFTPTPNPMTWSSGPAATASTSITMTAATASDASGVEYFFDETTNNPGGTDSGWQDSPVYVDSGLNPATNYSYRVKVRDKSPGANETEWSPVGFATTDAPDDYATWAVVYAPTDLSDPNADHDGDGMTNDEERAFGLNPTSGASSNPISVPLNPATGTFSYTRRSPALTNLTYAVLTSGALGGWTKDSAAVQAPGTPDANGIQTVAVTLSSGLLSNPKLFVRVSASPVIP